MDFLLNIAVFMWLGAVCPWDRLFSNEVIPTHRLVLFGVLVLLFRRLPVIILLRHQIPQIRHFRHALIMGFFGPIGVSAIFYLYVTQDFLHCVQANQPARKDLEPLADVTLLSVWFLVLASVVSESRNMISRRRLIVSSDCARPGHSLGQLRSTVSSGFQQHQEFA